MFLFVYPRVFEKFYILLYVTHYLQYFFQDNVIHIFVVIFPKENFRFISQNLLEHDMKWHTLESDYDLYLKAIHIQT